MPTYNRTKTAGRVFHYPLLGLAFALLSSPTKAIDVYGYLGLEARAFLQAPLNNEQDHHNASLLANLQVQEEHSSGKTKFIVNAFARVDSADTERSHADFRELFWWQRFEQWELSLGVKKIFWGVTESVHVVDIINQTDTLENIDGEDKLGQPMLEASFHPEWGSLSVYALPYFRERQYPGLESRLRSAMPIADEPAFQASLEEKHVDFAFRYSHYIGAWDYGLAHFSGTNREPQFIPRVDSSGSLNLQPFYSQIDQSSLDVQATLDAALIKLELASIKEKYGERNTRAALGLEYVFFSAFNSVQDLSAVIEYQFDDRPLQRQSTAQNDLVLGARLAFNDMDGSELLVLLSQDLENDNRLISLETSRRLSNSWTIEAELRIFSGAEPATPEYDLRDDDYFQLQLRRYF